MVYKTVALSALQKGQPKILEEDAYALANEALQFFPHN